MADLSSARRQAEEALARLIQADTDLARNASGALCVLALRALLAATAPAPQPAQTLTRAEAIAAGIPIPPDAVGVRIWGASVTAHDPQPEADASVTSCPVDHDTCSRCGADTSDDPQVFVICDPCYGAMTASAVDLAALPIHFIAHLPRGRVFMHPDTPTSGVRDPWPPPMPRREALR